MIGVTHFVQTNGAGRAYTKPRNVGPMLTIDRTIFEMWLSSL